MTGTRQGKKHGFLKFVLVALLLAGSIYLLKDYLSGRFEVDLSDYPEPLVTLYENNPEAREFVKDYFNHPDDPGAGEISDDELSGGVPLFIQWDKRWGYFTYGSSVLGVTGCGPTCLSMVAVGLTDSRTATPAAVAAFSAQNGYYVPGTGTSWELMTAGAPSFGLYSEELPLAEELLVSALSSGKAIIASLGPGDFTSSGHYIVITGYEEGAFTVNDPNSQARSDKSWTYAELSPQILNLWAFSAA